jgi:hypothetical protein
VHTIAQEPYVDLAERLAVGHLMIDPITLDLMLSNRVPRLVLSAIRTVVCECLDPQGIDPHDVAGPVTDGNTMRACNPRSEEVDWLVKADSEGCVVSFPVELEGLLLEDEVKPWYHDGMVMMPEGQIPAIVESAIVGRAAGMLVETCDALDAATVTKVEEGPWGGLQVHVEKRSPILLRDHPLMAAEIEDGR